MRSKIYFNSQRFKWVDVEITNACNFDCWFCPRGAMTRSQGVMDYDKFKEMVSVIDSANIIEDMLIGGIGEPTLHPSLVDMFAFLKKNTNLNAILITNGSKFIDKDFCKDLLDTGINKVIISLRITDPIKQGQSLPLGFSFDEYIDSLVEFVKMKYDGGYKTTIEIAFLKETYYSKYVLGLDTADFIDGNFLDVFIKRLSAVICNDLILHSEYTSKVKSKLVNVQSVEVADGLIFRFDGPSCWTTAVEKFSSENECYPANYGSCLGLLEHFAVYWNGDVAACCADFDVKNKLGNIFEEKNIIRILSSKKALFISESLRKKKMPTLTCKICRGGSSKKEKWANILGTLLYIK